MMGETQLLSRWLWVIVNKVKLITDGWQLWSHLLPGAEGHHFEAPLKLWCRCPPVHMDFVSPGPSYCDNLSSGLDRMNRRSPAILFFFFFSFLSDTYLWSLVCLCEHSLLIMWTPLHPDLESRCAVIQAESQSLFNSQRPCSLRNRVFVCIETLISCSNRPQSDHREIFF